MAWGPQPRPCAGICQGRSLPAVSAVSSLMLSTVLLARLRRLTAVAISAPWRRAGLMRRRGHGAPHATRSSAEKRAVLQSGEAGAALKSPRRSRPRRSRLGRPRRTPSRRSHPGARAPAPHSFSPISPRRPRTSHPRLPRRTPSRRSRPVIV